MISRESVGGLSMEQHKHPNTKAVWLHVQLKYFTVVKLSKSILELESDLLIQFEIGNPILLLMLSSCNLKAIRLAIERL